MAGEVLLHSHAGIGPQIHGSIGDAEAALALGGTQLVHMVTAAAQEGAHRELVGRGLPMGRPAAGGADLSSSMGHTVGAAIHDSLSFSDLAVNRGEHPVARPGCTLSALPERSRRVYVLFPCPLDRIALRRCAPTATAGGSPTPGYPGVGGKSLRCRPGERSRTALSRSPARTGRPSGAGQPRWQPVCGRRRCKCRRWSPGPSARRCCRRPSARSGHR